MATLRADVLDVNRLTVDFRKAAIQSGHLVRVGIRKICIDTQRDARLACPVKSGNLRSSIGYETRELATTVIGEVGPTASYGAYVEYGTSRMAPRAYMGPAFDRNAWQLESLAENLGNL